jgi:hypothetical protein
MKAPAVEQIHEAEHFKRLYWNLDTNPTKGPPIDLCRLGVRNCVIDIDWTAMDSAAMSPTG